MTVEQELIAIPTPQIGQGHILAAAGIDHYLTPRHDTEIITINDAVIALGRKRHQELTQSAQLATGYIETADNERNGFKGVGVIADMVTFMAKHLKDKTLTITPQDHIAKAAIFLNLRTLLYVIDSQTKRGMPAVSHLELLVWNLTAYERVLRDNPQAKVRLIEPISLTAPHQEIEPLEDEHIIIALSGSGADPQVIKQLIQSMANDSTPIKVATDNPDHAISCISSPATQISKGTYLSSLRSLDISHTVICFPSENVHILANENPRKIAFLYPRGSHELDNVIWAIRNNLTNVVIAPRNLHTKLGQLILAKGVTQEDFALIDPSQFSLSDLRQSQKWEKSPDAMTLFDAIG